MNTPPEMTQDEMDQTQPEVAPPARPKVRKVKKVGKAAKKAKAISKEPVLKKGYVALKTILADLNLPADGKLARRRLRAAGHNGEGANPQHAHNDRWVFSPKQAQKVRALLSGSNDE